MTIFSAATLSPSAILGTGREFFYKRSKVKNNFNGLNLFRVQKTNNHVASLSLITTMCSLKTPSQAKGEKRLLQPNDKKHFVLLHTGCHGSWCWYKIVELMKSSGHNVTALDLGGSGSNAKQAIEITSFSDYLSPLMKFMASLPADEKIVLVGHSFAGLGISKAMENFPEKISVAVFIAALMPGPSFSATVVYTKVFFMANDSEYKLDPGPLESNVLTGQLTHRSQDIWEGNVNMILNTRREDGNFWKLIEKYPIHPRVLEVIRLSGLYGVYKSNRPAIDRSLITALVERWRPETHTFHFRTGEATITLQDVEVLYGLPVNGDPVLGNEMIRTIEDWQNICQRLLGFVPSREDFKKNSIKVAAFNSHMLSQPHLSNMATQDMVNQKARCFMFWMIAGMMMADTSGGYLKLMYLPMLEDVNKIGSYSWGSATLAYLYHFLCKASQSTQNEIAGFLPLLQIWAWERVTVLRPQIVAHRDARTICHVGLPRGPHATRWFAHLSWTNTTKHVLKVYRDALDSMIEDQFIWEPYSDDLIESLPLYCHAGRDIWRVRVPIFCWDVVEVHLPDRVMRQFGLQQAIPTPFPFDSNHFRHDRRGRPNTNWELEHAHWLSFWNQRLQYSCDAPVNNEPLRYDDPYLIWFRRITRLVIGNPNSRPQNQQGYVPNSTAYETMVRHIHSMVDEAKTLGDNPSYEALYMFRKMVRDQGSDCLKYVHEADRVHVSADYRRDVVQPVQLHHPVRRRGKGGVAGRRERAVERAQTHVEIDQATQNVQEALEDDQATSNYNIGSISGGCTHEFTQASNMTYQLSETDIMPYVTPQTLQISSHPSLSSLENVIGNFENVPNFNSSPVPLIIETPDATNSLEDPNHDVDDNDPKDASEGGDTTIQNSEPSRREKRKIKLKPCGTGGHYAIQHVQKQRAKNK